MHKVAGEDALCAAACLCDHNVGAYMQDTVALHMLCCQNMVFGRSLRHAKFA